MTAPPLRFAIVGAGMIAGYHRTAIDAHPGAELAAVVHHDPNRFDAVATAMGAPCRTLDDVLSDGSIDVLSICTPSGQHARQAIAGIAAGKHVLVEKPMALSLQSADALIEAAESADRSLGVVLQRRHDPTFSRIKAAVDANELGELTLGVLTLPYFRGQAYYDQAGWRGTWALDGGGVLMNQGIHLIDLLVWFMGDPVAIQAVAETRQRAIEVEDVAAAVLSFAGGAQATIAATTTAGRGFPHRLELYGTEGGIQIEGEQVVRWGLADPSGAPVAPHTPAAAGAAADPRGISAAGHVAVVADFVAAVREGRPPLVDGHEGRRSLAAVIGIYEAADLL